MLFKGEEIDAEKIIDDIYEEGLELTFECSVPDIPHESYAEPRPGEEYVLQKPLVPQRSSDAHKFRDLAERMRPIVVEGLERVSGVLGLVEEGGGGERPPSDLDESELQTALGDVESGPPPSGAVLWADVALYTEHRQTAFNNVKSNPIALKLTEESMLPGFLVACRHLRPGQSGKFLLPPHTMYGSLGCPGRILGEFFDDGEEESKEGLIPPNATILLYLYSIKWLDEGAIDRYDNLAESAKKELATVRPCIGSINAVAADYFSKKIFKRACALYEKLADALTLCVETEENVVELKSERYRTYLNLAVCSLRAGNAARAMICLDLASVLRNFRDDCKYFYLRGKCHASLAEYEEAMECFLEGLELEPLNIKLGEEMLKIDEIVARRKRTEDSISKRMFNNDADEVELSAKEKEIGSVISSLLKTTRHISVPFMGVEYVNSVSTLEKIVRGMGCKVFKSSTGTGQISIIDDRPVTIPQKREEDDCPSQNV